MVIKGLALCGVALALTGGVAWAQAAAPNGQTLERLGPDQQ